MLLLFSDVIIQTNTNKFFIVRYLSNFTTCVGGQIKAFGFLFLPLVMQKVQMVESVNIQSDCETNSKKRIDLFCVFNSGKVQKGEER